MTGSFGYKTDSPDIEPGDPFSTDPDTSIPGAVERLRSLVEPCGDGHHIEMSDGSPARQVLDQHDADDRALRDLLRQCVEALEVIRTGDAPVTVAWLNRQGYRTGRDVRDYKGRYSGGAMVADIMLAAAQKALEEQP